MPYYENQPEVLFKMPILTRDLSIPFYFLPFLTVQDLGGEKKKKESFMLLVCTCDHRADLVAQLLTANARLSAGHSFILSQWKLRAAKRRH